MKKTHFYIVLHIVGNCFMWNYTWTKFHHQRFLYTSDFPVRFCVFWSLKTDLHIVGNRFMWNYTWTKCHHRWYLYTSVFAVRFLVSEIGFASLCGNEP